MSEQQPLTTVAVICAGTMGDGVAQLFATFGYGVRLTDSQATIRAGALSRIRKNLHFMDSNGYLAKDGTEDKAEAEIEAILARVSVVESVEATVSGAGVVIEAIFEEMELKHTLLRELEALCQ